MDINAVIDGINAKKSRQVCHTSKSRMPPESPNPPWSASCRKTDRTLPSKRLPILLLPSATIWMSAGHHSWRITQKMHTSGFSRVAGGGKRLAEKRLEQQQASYHRQLAGKSRVIRYLAMSLILVITFLLTWLIIDVTHPNIGWFQRETYYGGSGIQYVLAAICRWLGM